jgi:GNAT superfamily N-acetyltransferase
VASVLHLSRRLVEGPTVTKVSGVAVRTFTGEDDISRWLALRAKAFVDQTPVVRPWTQADFKAEFLDKPWWSPERMWFAEADDAIGSVTLAMRGHQAAATPVVHWLMVLSEWRRRGVGKLLMRTLETACWRAGYRHISLETHAGWSAAEAFYRALGYGADEG